MLSFPANSPLASSRRTISILTMVAALTALSIDIYLPSIPDIAVELETSVATVKLSMTLFVLAFGLGQLAFGPLSDHYGRKRPLLASLAVYVASNLLCAFAPSIEVLLFARALQGLAACGAAVSYMAIARDLFAGPEMGRVMAKIASAVALAPILAPSIGTLLANLSSWRMSFVFVAAFGALLFYLVARDLPETVAQRRPIAIANVFQQYVAIFSDRTWRNYSLVHALSFSALFAYLVAGSTVIIRGYGASRAQFSILFAVNALAYMLSSTLASRWMRTIKLSFLARAGMAMIASAGLLLVALSQLVSADCALLQMPILAAALLVIVPMCIATFGIGLAMPASAGLALEGFASQAGRAAALQGFVRFAVAALVGALVGNGQGATSMGIAIFVCGTLGWFATRQASASAVRQIL